MISGGHPCSKVITGGMAETLAYTSEPPPTPAAVATAIPGQKWNSIHPLCLAGSDTDHTNGSPGSRG